MRSRDLFGIGFVAYAFGMGPVLTMVAVEAVLVRGCCDGQVALVFSR